MKKIFTFSLTALFFLSFGNMLFGGTNSALDFAVNTNEQSVIFDEASPPSGDAVNLYTWAQSTSTYTSISGTGTLIGSGLDDNVFSALNIGFTFNFDGVAYTQFGLNANGWISLGSTVPVNSYTPISTGTTNNVISAMARDLYGLATGNGVYYQTTGSAPNRILTVEWKNWGVYSTGLSEYNFQIKLYETSDSINIVYGPYTPTTAGTVEVGLRGASNADFNNRTTTTDWSATTAGTLNSSSCTISSTVYPSNGLTWRWAPPPPSPMVYTSSTSAQITNGLNVLQNSVDNQILQVQVVMSGTLSPINMTGMGFNTTGTTAPPSDITTAKVYYTGTSSVFSNSTLFGSVSGPNGTFNVSGTQVLAAGTNYFWLVYDVPTTAPVSDYLDAQITSITGSGTMGVQTPTVTNPAGRRQVDNYCRGTVSNNGCLGTGIYITNVTFNTLNNTSTCDPDANFPYAYSWFGNLSTTVEQGVTYSISASTLSSTNQQGFAVWIDWDNNGTFDASEYTPFPLITSGSSTTTSTTITVPPLAPVGNHRMRVRNNFSALPTNAQACALLSYGETEDYTVNITAASPMTYTSSTVTQNNTSTVTKPSLNTEIIGIQIVAAGSLTPLSATSFTLNTTGSTNPSTDITNAKLWYTGITNSFGTTNLYGTAASPNGTFTINGSQVLAPGTNYFWLTYDVPGSATTSDLLDAECTSINIVTPRIPTVTAPTGSRQIGANKMAGVYTIPGDYPHISTAVADLNSRGTYGPVTFNVASGFVDTAVNVVITATGTALNPIVFQRFGADPLPNPVIVAGTGTSTTVDGIIKINGGDYITFDGIDLQENPANVTTTTQMEWGYALVKPNGTNGSQYNTIKNCTITLNKTNTASVGIYGGNHLPTSTTAIPVTVLAGANSYNTFYNNTITNAYIGMSINGYADGVPYSFYDQSNAINQCNITNYGGSTVTTYGIYNIYQNGLNISNCTINSSGGTNSISTMYGIFCSTMNNSNLTIANNTVTIVSGATTSTIYGINFGNGSAGTTNNINILNNTIQNCTYATATSGAMYHLYCNAVSNNLTVSGNRIIGNTYGTAATSTGIAYYIYSLSSPLSSITFTNNLDSGNVVNGTTAYAGYYMYNSVTTMNATITGNRVVNNIAGGTTATGSTYGIYNSGGSFTCTMNNNTVSNNSMVSTSSQSMYCMYNLAPAATSDYSNNTVSGNTSTGTGTIYGMYYSAAPGLGSTVNITNNNITNLSKTTATGTGSIYGLYHGSSEQGTINLNNNTITGFSSAAATSFYGIYQIGSPPNYLNINGNKVGNFNTAGAGTIYGIYNNPTSTTVVTEAQDSIFNLTSAGGTIYGMYIANGASINFYKDKISSLTSTTSTTAVVYGIYSGVSNAAAVINLYNNFISDLNATASTSIAPAVAGIYIPSGAATTYLNLFYNTVYLNAVSTSATTFGTAGVYALTTPPVTMANNIIVNNSTPGPTGGQTVAYRRSSTTLTTYTATSNNNCFYAGTPSATRLIYYDGTNSDQTLAAYKTRVVPRDNVSVTENPPFVNGTTPPYDLRIQTSISTQLESGGKIITTPLGITDDGFGTARYPNAGYPVGGFTPVAPDIGAHEFGGLNTDNVPPSITYTALGNAGATTNRSFSNVIITDGSGVNITSGTKPRCYYKRSTDGNTINDTTNLTDGWKYAEANGTTSPFDFTIDYTKLFGGTGVAVGNVIQYFVIAQDLAGVPNVGAVQALFTTSPNTVNLAASHTPISSTLSYTIISNTFSGAYNVGTAQTYTSLTGASGIFAAINAGAVSGDITITITSDLTEDGTNALNALNEIGTGGYKVKIIPGSASMKTISGAVANGLIRFNGVRRVTIDGDGGLSGKYLTFRNTNGANPTFTFINDAVRDTIKNCFIEGNNSGTASGTILFSTTTGTQGNDSNVIMNCDIRDRSDATGYPANAIYSSGTTTTLAQYNNYNVITGCNIYNNFLDAASTIAGIYLSTGSSNWTISNNSFYQTLSRTIVNSLTFTGIYNSSTLDNDLSITGNYFGGTAPNCGGTAMTYSGAGLYNFYAMYMNVGGIIPTSVQSNTIQNISLTTSPASSVSTFFRGIYVPTSTSWVNIGNISGNTIGSGTGTGSITFTMNTTASGYTIILIQHVGIGSIMNNVMGSITIAGNNAPAATNSIQCINWSNTTSGQIYTVSNNLMGSLTTPNSIQQTNTASGNSDRGIVMSNGAGTTNNVTNNVIANWTDYSTSVLVASSVYGIQNSGAGNYNMTGNTVFNLTNNCNVVTASFMLLGVNSTATGFNNYIQNDVHSLYANAGTGAQLVGGILAGGTAGGTVSRNKIYDLRFSGTGIGSGTPLILGLNVQSSGQYLISNNMISLTNGDVTDNSMKLSLSVDYKQETVENPPINLSVISKENNEAVINSNPVLNTDAFEDAGSGSETGNVMLNLKNPNAKQNMGDESTVNVSIAGVYHTSTSPGPTNYYYNTFYVGGTQPSGSYNSWTFVRTSTGSIGFMNNLFINARTGGLGYHFVIGNEGSVPSSGWTQTASNYNVFIGSNAGTIGEWYANTAQSISQWVSSSGGDKQTWSATSSALNPVNLLTSIGTCNLTIQTGNQEAWIVSGKGIAVSGQNIDFNGDSRVTTISGGCTDIGADEFTATPPSNLAATQSGVPGSGTITDYTLYGRKICTIEWGTDGTSYPTTMNVNYYSGINPINTATLGPNYGASYWTVLPGSGTLSGASYDITFYFGDNETYTITSPTGNTILAKYDNAWQDFGLGSGLRQSDVNWSTLSVKTRSLNNFSSFALTDASLSASLISPAHNVTLQPLSLNLTWHSFTGAVSYKVQVATDSLFSSLIVNDSTLTDTTKAVSGLSQVTNYWWRVIGKNSGGTVGYSATWRFRTMGSVNQVALIYPPNNSTNIPVSLNFTWNKATEQTLAKLTGDNKLTEGYKDDIETISNYWFELVTDTVSMANLTRDTTLTDTTKSASGLSNLTNYYWRVKAKNQMGWGLFSAWWKFTTITAAPVAPVLISPPNGASGQPLSLNLVWHPSAGATSYRLQLSTDAGFGSFIINDSTVTDTIKAVSGLSQQTIYYWRVNAKNIGGTSSFSAAWNFTTQSLIPSLDLKVYLEGFYSPEPGDNNGKNTKGGKDAPLAQVVDTVMIYLADSLQGYAFKDSVKVVLSSAGTVTTPFTNATTGKYYIVIRHRNHLETWSKYGVNFTGGSTTSYDFTTGASQAYGDNMKLIGSVWVLFGGDPNQDGDIGALDIPIFISEFGTQGYLSCDFNGDNDVTGVDQQILIQNFGITVARPTTLLIVNPEKGKGLKEYQNKLKELQGRDIKNNK
jgi:hypothetical protein